MKNFILLIFFLFFVFNNNAISEDELPFILNAEKIVNNYPESNLREIILKFGEEPRANKIAKSKYNSNTILIALTAHDKKSLLNEYHNSPFQGLLVKPLDVNELYDVLISQNQT